MSLTWVIVIALTTNLVTGFVCLCIGTGIGYKRRLCEEIAEVYRRARTIQ